MRLLLSKFSSIMLKSCIYLLDNTIPFRILIIYFYQFITLDWIESKYFSVESKSSRESNEILTWLYFSFVFLPKFIERLSWELMIFFVLKCIFFHGSILPSSQDSVTGFILFCVERVECKYKLSPLKTQI